MPRFSIVLPTKNRADLIETAIMSVLWQTEPDWELIVVDNDDGPETEHLVARLDDRRIRYERTGGLTMPDNWDTGFRLTTGRYLLLLTDKQAWRPNCLSSVRKTIDSTGAEAVTWGVDRFDDRPGRGVFDLVHREPDTEITRRSSHSILEMVLTEHHSKSRVYVPKLANSCCSRSLYSRIVSGPMQRFCCPIDPAWTAAFLQLAYVDEVFHIPVSLCAVRRQRSNGMQVLSGKDKTYDYMGKVDTSTDLTPVDALLHYNLIMNDFLKLRSIVGQNLRVHELNLRSYYIHLYQDISEFQIKFGTDVSQQTKAWSDALKREDRTLKNRVLSTLTPERRMLQRDRLSRMTRPVRRCVSGALAALRKMAGYSTPGRPLDQSPLYPDVLSALKATTPDGWPSSSQMCRNLHDREVISQS